MGLQIQVRVKRKALPEIIRHINTLNSNNDVAIRETSTMFRNIMSILQRERDAYMNNDGTKFLEHVIDNLIDEKEGNKKITCTSLFLHQNYHVNTVHSICHAFNG